MRARCRGPSRRDSPADVDPAVADLRHVLTLGLERGGRLLSAGEHAVVRRLLALDGEAARLYALLSQRAGPAWPLDGLAPPGVEDPLRAAERLVADDLADHLVPWSVRAELLPRRELAAACKRLDLPVGGRRAELVERLRDLKGWRPGRWLRLRHTGLLRRLERFAFLRKHPDRSVLVVERLGHVRWPGYTPTAGPDLFAGRRALLAWEALLDQTDPDAIVEGVKHGAHRGPGRLDLGRTLGRALVEHARQLEREGCLQEARARYLQAEALLGVAEPVRVARTLELEGLREEALAHLLQARQTAGPAEALAIARAGRRLAASLRRAWPPDPPLRTPPVRRFSLPAGPMVGQRPGYAMGEDVVPVEEATVRWLEQHGRRALHVEGALWTTLFALLFAEAWFLQVPGALPVRFLDAPLDLGTPAFRERRRETVDRILQALHEGEGTRRLAQAWERLHGTRLAGVSWQLAPLEVLLEVTDGLGGSGLARVMEALLDGGRAGAGGLPDLVVLPGAEVRLDGSHPSKLGSGLLLAEVKGPGDTLRDAQAVWLHRLLQAGVPAELWEVGRSP